jgi:hypothetical protein
MRAIDVHAHVIVTELLVDAVGAERALLGSDYALGLQRSGMR